MQCNLLFTFSSISMANKISLIDRFLRIFYWNTRSFRQRHKEILSIKQDYDIIICVESWLSVNDVYHLSGFTTFRKDRLYSRGGGIIIFIRNNIKFTEIKNIVSPVQEFEICGLKISNIIPSIDLIICYRAPGINHTQDQWDMAIKNVNTNNHSILIGDFNAHHINWNCRQTDTNGNRLENSIDKSDLVLHNDNTLTHIDKHNNTKSNIDLVFTTPNLSHKINFTVHDEPWGSDHFPIFINIGIEKEKYEKKSFKIKSKRTDWTIFENNLNLNYNEFLSLDYDLLNTIEKYKYFKEVIVKATSQSTPVRKKVNNKDRITNPVSWWDSTCDRVKRQRRAAFKKWQFSLELDDLINYNRMCALATKTFRTKKKEHFKNFASSINFRTDPKYVWNTCKVLKNSFVKLKPSSNSESLHTDNKVPIALNKISPPWAQTNPEFIPQSNDNEFFDTPFNFVEFNIALENKNINSSPGMDGIDFEVLKRLPLNYKLILLDIFNEMHTNNIYPAD